jgi:hypothetical protein
MDENAQKRGSRKLRRFLVGFALLALAVLLAHGLWNMGTRNHLRARIVAIQARGEPILPEDFDVKDADAEDNAAADIVAAAGMINMEDEYWSALSKFNPALPLRPKERDAMAAVSAHSGDVFSRLETAMGKPRAVRNPRFRSPVMQYFITSDFNSTRQLASLVGDDALLAHDRGDDATAMRRIQQLLLLSRYADTEPTLIGHLIGIGISEIAASHLLQMSADLKVGSAAGEASPRELRKVIDELLDDAPPTEGFRRALLGERMFQADMFKVMADGTPVQMLPNQPPQPYFGRGRAVLQPLVNANAATALDYMGQLIPLAAEKNLPEFRARSPQAPNRPSMFNFLLAGVAPSLDRAFETHFRGVTDRHLAATVLAIRWYAVEHDGKYPQDPGELAPKYLPAIPSDPMAPAGQSLHYVRGAAPAVYSVGVNSIDDNCDGADKRGDRYSWTSLDHVIPLTLPPRPLEDEDDVESPSTQSTTAP